MKTSKVIIAYTDGSASVAGKMKGYGGFGTHFPDLFGKEVNISKGFIQSKTGRCEVSALAHAIMAMPTSYSEKITLRVYSDSEYVVKTFTEGRLKKWILNDWVSYGKEIKNRDLWEVVLRELMLRKSYIRLEMIHIRSHQVEKAKKDTKLIQELLSCPHIRGNRKADELANYKEFKNYLKSDKIK